MYYIYMVIDWVLGYGVEVVYVLFDFVGGICIELWIVR